MDSHSQKTVPHRGATNVWWISHQNQYPKTEYVPINHESHRLIGYDDHTYENWGIRHPSPAAHIALDRLLRSLSQKDHETLRPDISHESIDTKDNLEVTNADRWSADSGESWRQLSGDEDDIDRPPTPVSPEPLLSNDGLDQDIEDYINQMLQNPVPKDLGLEDKIHRYLEKCSTLDLRSECRSEGSDGPPRSSMEKHRDTVSSKTTDRSNIIPDLASEYDRDSDDEQVPLPEAWYRNASAPSQFSSTTASAELLDAYVSLGGRVKSLIRFAPEEPPSPLDSNIQEQKPLPPLPLADTTHYPFLYRANDLPRRSSLRPPPLGPYGQGSWTTSRSHIANQIRTQSPRPSVRLPTKVASVEMASPHEPFGSSSSSSPAPLDHLRNHPAFRDQCNPSHLRYSSSGSGNSTAFSPLSSPISTYNPYQTKGRESGSSQSSQPRQSYRRYSQVQSILTQSSSSSTRYPLSTVSGLGSSVLSTISDTQPEIHATPEPEQPETTCTRRYSIENALNVHGSTFYANPPPEIPVLRRRNTEESDMQSLLRERKEQVIQNIKRNLEEAEKSSQSIQNHSPTVSKAPSLSQRFGLRRLASDARLIYSSRNTRSTTVLLSTSTPTLLSPTTPLRPSRSNPQPPTRHRTSSLFSRDLSRIIEREDQAHLNELLDDAYSNSPTQWPGEALLKAKVRSLKAKLPGREGEELVPTCSEKAARMLGGVPGFAPEILWERRRERAEEVRRGVERLVLM